MKEIILRVKTKVSNFKSNRGYKKGVCVEAQSVLDQLADKAQRDLEFYLEEV